MFVNLENETNNMSNQFKNNLFVIIAKRSKDEKRNKNDLKLLANNFY